MKNITRSIALLGLALISVQAQAVQFDFLSNAGTLTQGYGNTYTAELEGLRVTASAWSMTAGNAFEAGELNLTADGMGAYGQDENRNASNADVLGNRTAKGVDTSDLILFSFSNKVNLQSLSTYQVGKDSDLSLWAGSGTFSPEGMTATLYENANSVGGIRIVGLNTFNDTYDWLAVAARIGQKDDFVRLQSLMVTPVAQPVPDAATWMTMLAGLGFVGFAVKRRTRA